MRLTPSGGTANAVRLFVRDRCSLSGDRPGRGDFFAVPQYRYDQRFSPRVLGCDRSGRAGCLDLGWRRLSYERTTRSAGQCKPDPTATLLPRAQSDRQPLALSTANTPTMPPLKPRRSTLGAGSAWSQKPSALSAERNTSIAHSIPRVRIMPRVATGKDIQPFYKSRISPCPRSARPSEAASCRRCGEKKRGGK